MSESSSTESGPSDPRVDEAVADYLRRIDAGEQVDVDRFISENPDVREELKNFLDDLNAFHDFAASPVAIAQSLSPTHGNMPFVPRDPSGAGNLGVDGSGIFADEDPSPLATEMNDSEQIPASTIGSSTESSESSLDLTPSARVLLRVTAGPLTNREYAYESHDTFLFGRDVGCQASVPEDRHVSRHHFVLEINPPAIRLIDLGSLNGTFVNGNRVGRRRKSPGNEPRRQDQPTHMDLKHGDVIAVGETRIEIHVASKTQCRVCDTFLPESVSSTGEKICPTCQRRTASTVIPLSPVKTAHCVNCNSDVAEEVGHSSSDAYVCRNCREKLRRSSRELRQLVAEQTQRTVPSGAKRQLGGYLLDRVLGKGATAVVYRAYSASDAGEAVALKVMLTDAALDDKAAKRILREIAIGLDLKHERIVQAMGHGSIGNIFYVVMELCNAGSLEGLLKKHGGRLAVDKAIRLMAMCLEGMEYAHQRKLVHRDLKPRNILLRKGPQGKLHPKISDFGLAKSLELAGLSGMTMTGSFGGSWHYMPREQVTNFKFVGPVSDVWSLGATFYQVLTGTYPRDCPPKKDPVQMVLQETAIPIRQRDPGIPKELAAIVDRALADDPEKRYPDAGAMRQALLEIV